MSTLKNNFENQKQGLSQSEIINLEKSYNDSMEA